MTSYLPDWDNAGSLQYENDAMSPEEVRLTIRNDAALMALIQEAALSCQPHADEYRRRIEMGIELLASASATHATQMQEMRAELVKLRSQHPVQIWCYKDDMTPERREEVKRLAESMSDKVNILVPHQEIRFEVAPPFAAIQAFHEGFQITAIKHTQELNENSLTVKRSTIESIEPSCQPSDSSIGVVHLDDGENLLCGGPIGDAVTCEDVSSPVTCEKCLAVITFSPGDKVRFKDRSELLGRVIKYDIGNDAVMVDAPDWHPGAAELMVIASVGHQHMIARRDLALWQADPDEDDDDDDDIDTPDFETDVVRPPSVPEICTCPKDHNLMMGHLASCPLSRG